MQCAFDPMCVKKLFIDNVTVLETKQITEGLEKTRRSTNKHDQAIDFTLTAKDAIVSAIP